MRTFDKESHTSGVTICKRRSSKEQEVSLKDLDYADDIALLECFRHCLQISSGKVEEISSPTGLTFNAETCRIMSVNDKCNAPICVLSNEYAKEVHSFNYLGSLVTDDRKSSKKIHGRIALAGDKFSKFNKLWRERNLSIVVKMHLFNASVIPTLHYTTETLNMSTEDERRLDTFQNKCIRKILHINWKQKKSNEYIRGVTKQLFIQKMLRKRRLRYCERFSQMEKKRLPKLAMNWVSDSKRPCGRPPRCWFNVIEKDLKMLDLNLDLKADELIAQNQAQYRNLIR